MKLLPLPLKNFNNPTFQVMLMGLAMEEKNLKLKKKTQGLVLEGLQDIITIYIKMVLGWNVKLLKKYVIIWGLPTLKLWFLFVEQ